MLLCEVEIIMYEELTSFLHGKQPINDILFEEAVYKFVEMHLRNYTDYGDILEKYGIIVNEMSINDVDISRLDGQGTLAVLLWINRMNHFDFYILPGLIREGYI